MKMTRKCVKNIKTTQQKMLSWVDDSCCWSILKNLIILKRERREREGEGEREKESGNFSYLIFVFVYFLIKITTITITHVGKIKLKKWPLDKYRLDCVFEFKLVACSSLLSIYLQY